MPLLWNADFFFIKKQSLLYGNWKPNLDPPLRFIVSTIWTSSEKDFVYPFTLKKQVADVSDERQILLLTCRWFRRLDWFFHLSCWPKYNTSLERQNVSSLLIGINRTLIHTDMTLDINFYEIKLAVLFPSCVGKTKSVNGSSINIFWFDFFLQIENNLCATK